MAREADASILLKNFCDYIELAEHALRQKKYNQELSEENAEVLKKDAHYLKKMLEE